jgi:hypothetical protein
MRIQKSGHEILSVEDWFKHAPPKLKEVQWVDKCSAKELAKSWFRKESPCPPDEMRQLLEETFRTRVVFREAEPECVIKLDEFAGEHRNCDLVAQCDLGGRRMVINIEAKGAEPFGQTIGKYYDQTCASTSNEGARKPPRRSNVPARIRQLSLAVFGKEPDQAIRRLRYQLLHSAAATLIEAQNKNAELGLFLVHEFRSEGLGSESRREKFRRNAADWENFVHAFPELATARVEQNQILGPISVLGGGLVPNGVPLYLGKLATELGELSISPH